MKSTTSKTNASVALDYPFKRGEQTIDSISVRRPSAGELRGVSLTDLMQMNTDALTKVIPRITQPSLTEAEVKALDPVDLVQLGSEIVGFLVPKRLQTAE